MWTEPQVKKHLTAEEHAMRRAEMARRRKNLSEKRNEEEKVYSINILTSQTTRVIPLSRTRADRPIDGYDQQASQEASPQAAWQGSSCRDRGGHSWSPRGKGARETGSHYDPVGEQPRQLQDRCTARMVRHPCGAGVRRRTTVHGDQWVQKACRGSLIDMR